MSLLQNQTASFLSEAQGAASRGYGQRRGLSPAPPSTRPSPTPATKRPHDEANRVAETPAIVPTINFGDKNIMTQVTGAVAWLRDKANSKSCVLLSLSLEWSLSQVLELCWSYDQIRVTNKLRPIHSP